MQKSRRQPALFLREVDNCPIAMVENGPFVLGPRCSARPSNACFGTRPCQQFVFRHARRWDDTRDAAGFFHSHPSWILPR